ncbi:3-dehydro-L-gulonate 2-dehydrogenase [Mucilaginibacter yixingensis]|uniref:3-dehydro-L-gulonate 2-dehydrogenase n=1 Tax=Mucilaginibacter yixingensis TaxID=1295612 RepID=A0A2T5J804_9SPHI|nr:3-dehydro-L-gulonate 2-dehydrogenase [Mucilaginibacter yixingensis]PTQ95576.1 3-dehydro-L-gulonate 2-dehydrogenase [Mucilaginibacter yixingensis]
MRIAYQELKAEFERILLSLDFNPQKANAIAGIFADNSLDGVYTHGLNRFPVFVQYVKDGLVKVDAEPALVDAMGAIERWDGQLGPGMLNARFCMDRALQLAAAHGTGCAAIRNTNHWMRGGTYGWQAADAGYIGINFTNTVALMPPWGGIDPRQGNNPMVIAVPRKDGHVVLDMAITQFSNGKLLQYQAAGEQLPVPGGYSASGWLSTDPGEILESKRHLPIGFWKGSGLSMMIDLLVSVLSHGKTTAGITQSGSEYGVSQVFMAIRPDDEARSEQIIDEIIAYSKESRTEGDGSIRYPGEGTLRTRQRNQKDGIPVDVKIWEQVKSL